MSDIAGESKARLGVPGLDDILAGGLARGHLYLLEGSPGMGKSALALGIARNTAPGPVVLRR